jgi:hypothetical protein
MNAPRYWGRWVTLKPSWANFADKFATVAEFDVCFWHEADMALALNDVCFEG